MSFHNIQNISRSTVQSTNYFVDANVWIYSLQGDTTLQHWQQRYSDFFYDIIESSIDPKPKVIIPSLLFSEVLNTWLTNISLPEYKAINGISNNERFSFKRDYRPTLHYRENYEKICDDILSMKDSLTFINDSRIVSHPPLYIAPVVDPFDFNDYFYYKICQQFQTDNSLTILTNDSDFQINDIPIITANRHLLNLS